MACYHPLLGYRSAVVGPSGKRAVVFDQKAPRFVDMPVSVPCGQCVGCRLERSRQWAIRCMHEASLYDANCFITLTYREECVPPLFSLRKRDFQLFMKRLRKHFSPQRVRFYACGEYGGIFGRPHYHACLFGVDFPDKYLWTERASGPVFRSPALELLWPDGLSEVGSVTFDSAAYVARYVMKKALGKGADEKYVVYDGSSGEVLGRRQPEYTDMSRRPGVGMEWFQKYHREVYASDSVVVNGREVKPPRFYDKHFEEQERSLWLRTKFARDQKRVASENTPERLEEREKVAISRVSLYS